MVVGVVVQHWVTVVIAGAEDWGERGQEGRHQDALFYAEDVMVESSDPRWIHGAFNILVGMFYRVVLRTNVSKTVRMVCCPCQAVENQSEAAYGRRIMGRFPPTGSARRDGFTAGSVGKNLWRVT